MANNSDNADLRKPPLHGVHLARGAKMVAFAGYEMPVRYKLGVLREHLHTRSSAGLFDVSHMGQAVLSPRKGGDVAELLERLVPGDIRGLQPGQMRYTMLMNEAGGILDDLMVTRPAAPEHGDKLFLVVNAACKSQDFAHIARALAGEGELKPLEDRALLALQGPKAAEVLARHIPQSGALGFMYGGRMDAKGADLMVNRCGYTGEDGFEISVPNDAVGAWAERLLNEPEVEPIGLGARDSLRLEAGLCLYGHDIDETTTPVEAALAWSIGKRRREEGGFPGCDIIRQQLADGPSRLRVGLRLQGRAPAREGAEIVGADGAALGRVTSGTFGPSVGGPVAMGYVKAAHAKIGEKLFVVVRGKHLEAEVVPMPFTEKHYHRKD